jgi:LAS superfamily LD-carboxypeptidase LdcB
MLGLSGPKIYETYTIDTTLLPNVYKDKVQFICSGVSHKVSDDGWITTLNSICGPRHDGVTISNPPNIKNITKVEVPKAPESNNNGVLKKNRGGTCAKLGKEPILQYNGNVNKIGAQGVLSSNKEVKARKTKYNNGATTELVEIVDRGDVRVIKYGQEALLTPRAAAAFNSWADEITSQGGCMTVSSVFRTYEDQKRVKAQKVAEGRGNSAAEPGKSPHGWGVAIDIRELYQLVNGDSSPSLNAKARNENIYKFLASTGEKYGWYNPYRLADGANTEECWHFEYWG